ncbi:hypothetical protein FY557_17380 [Chryseobacterium sp. SN22]|uniref:hypothetical protein n=1 Tax=Chryseobacterium sp. SN22 TaxID=2606431 RepID=UPI0011F09880|nr:hypothetical protein [Chryseobacterium sp. SN22]KAA0126422.1 hypothetical protein FY557_17380 [Chryseobacterium sp. SN22]
MKEIAYDNGFINRWELERYDAKWINKIGPLAKAFFDANPERLTDDDIEEICAGEQGEVDETYGNLHGFKELLESLNDYFNNH